MFFFIIGHASNKPCNHMCVFYFKWNRKKNLVKSQIFHRTGFILPVRRQYFMPSGLQTCLCSLLEPAQWLLGKLVFVFWGQRYTCARALVCPLGFWRKERSSPSMSVLFQRCLLSKQSRWSWASGTRHKERKKKKKERAALRFLPNIFSVVAFPSHIRVFTAAVPPSGLVWQPV